MRQPFRVVVARTDAPKHAPVSNGTRVQVLACRLPRVTHYNENTEERENGKGPSIVQTLRALARALHRDDNTTATTNTSKVKRT